MLFVDYSIDPAMFQIDTKLAIINFPNTLNCSELETLSISENNAVCGYIYFYSMAMFLKFTNTVLTPKQTPLPKTRILDDPSTNLH